MALRTFVKISAVNNLSDARYCSGMQVNLMGFDLEENSKNFTTSEKFKEITDWLSGVRFVAEFEFSHPENILETLKSYGGFEFIQIKEEIHLKMLVNTEYGIILKTNIKSAGDIKELTAKADSYREHGVVLLLHSDNVELTKEVQAELKALAEKCSVLVGFGFHTGNILELIDQTGIKGIEMEGGDEIKPGLKDFDELADILELLEIED
ncbi:phosphoribosylanthranilate isomerase [Cecembia sp.]|uniref:phosphoribosylanthranilate isomerase n=1 Tax=Cecembia sp. TaxID=1898110 RepID=UPI0025C2E73C|nr:phosphoribosylanthranilate isomerase [Cecembia sp.]